MLQVSLANARRNSHRRISMEIVIWIAIGFSVILTLSVAKTVLNLASRVKALENMIKQRSADE